MNDIDKQIQNLEQIVKSAERILITSHIGPDGDSVSSSLLLYKILKLNFPGKSVVVSMEERPVGLDFLLSGDEIQIQPLQTALNTQPFDLLIILDANALHRVSRQTENVQNFLKDIATKVVVIDHHEGLNIDDVALHINNMSPAVTLDIYEIFIEKLKLQKPDNYAQIALTGIYTDTGGFVYRNLNFKKVFEVVPKLIADGADIEKLVYSLAAISQKALAILGELIANTKLENDHTYSFISDETAVLENHQALVQAEDIFKTQFLRSIEGRIWGYLVYRDVLAANLYSVSFRAQSDTKDVSSMAVKLGGGGHKPAAGAKFKASNIDQALNIVKQSISDN